jgi:hypothetical protein
VRRDGIDDDDDVIIFTFLDKRDGARIVFALGVVCIVCIVMCVIVVVYVVVVVVVL